MERLQELWKKIQDWWKKFTPKQKTIIICSAAGAFLALSILTYVLTRPQYTVLATCESTKEASQITDLLNEANIGNKVSADGLQISVVKSKVSDANLLLGANDIPTVTYSIDNVLEGGLSTTESDKQKRYLVLLESELEKTLERNEVVEKADVTLTIPADDGTLISRDEQSTAAVVLELSGELGQEKANALAMFIKNALGNKTTEGISIIDTTGNLLFSGDVENSLGGSASSQLSAKQQAENLVKQEVRSVLVGTPLYDSVEVSCNLDQDFSTKEWTDHDFTAAEGQSQGVLSSERIYEAENSGTTGGEPGTGSNGQNDTTYVMPDYADSSSAVSEIERNYLPHETITKITTPAGVIRLESSSIAVAATKLHVYKEEDVQAQGLLDGISWDEFKAANGENIQLEVSEDIYSTVAKATGIPLENIEIVAYERPIFIDKEGLDINIWDVLQIVLIVIILGLLAYVVLRSMRGEAVVEEEEELSVESLLQSTPQQELDNIELEEKSEIRKLIDKFVEENPEAVASLLRNWLQEDWG
ncbi:MAG: flagellar M-ring protein FliF [Lachnospiraceae bacterium]|nr:flagellar M-ring protein FliF [Lachnospiraceae bacterium]